MKSKILIFGKGFIGKRLHENLKSSISDTRIDSFKGAQKEITRHKPDIIINCVGFTGKRNIDDCEKDIDKTLSSNVFAPIILAEAALRNKIKFVHISSGCIYHYDYAKNKPITEEEIPDFLDLYYSRTKIYTERALSVLSERPGILIIRIRIPLDNRPHPRNILTKLVDYKKAIDIPNSVTYLPDFFSALKHLIKTDARGIYNVVNKGALKYPQLLNIYKKYVPGFRYQPIDYAKLNIVRTNLILSTAKLEKTGFKVRHIKDILEECVKDYIKY